MSSLGHYVFGAPEPLHAWLRVNHASETELRVRIYKQVTHHQLEKLRGGRYLPVLDLRAAQRLG